MNQPDLTPTTALPGTPLDFEIVSIDYPVAGRLIPGTSAHGILGPGGPRG